MSHPSKKVAISRKEFLRLAGAGLGALAGAPLLSACEAKPQETLTALPSPSETPLPLPTATHPPAATSTLEMTPTPLKEVLHPEVIKIFPAASSKVIETHHAGAWSGKSLVPGALRQMLDESITRLTGLNDSLQAWAALFKPTERIAIKVNAFSNSILWTHVPLVQAVTDSLREAGIPAENITIYDLNTYELKDAGFPVNPDGPGVRCVGSDNNFGPNYIKVLNTQIQLSNILANCDALINMPVLKSHMMAGITFAMKNHFGSSPYPESLHTSDMKTVSALNALPYIKDRTRLIVGDALQACVRYKNSYPYWEADWTGDSILMSFDPLAHDTLGLQKLSHLLEQDGGDPASIQGMAAPAMEYGTGLGIGTNDPAHIQYEEVRLS
jgi:hypothetical protein